MKLKPIAAAVALLGALPAQALQFELANGFRANIDTTLSYGIAVRASARDPSLIGIANGGTSRSVNEDDGNLNFDKGDPFANVFKATVDAEVKWRNFGFFGRGTAFYDVELNDSDKLGPTGKDRLGSNVVGLDGFFYANFEPGGKNLRVRAGRQVISWGESTFIPNGINVINPVDLSKLRIPGSELKEAFIPTTGLWGSFQLTQAATIEGFYLTNHDKVRIDPRGSYFSNNDFASDDANRVILSFGRRQDEHFPPANPVPPNIPGLGAATAAVLGPFNPAASVWAPRSADRNPSDDGQYGLALRYLATALNNTEFGFYYMNYHSRIPLFSGIKGTPSSALTGTPFTTPICAAPALRALCHTGTANYFAEYPEDIRLYGLSFNTQGPLGIAVQGEYAYRPNQPLQYATPELLLASLGLPNLVTGFTQIPGAPTGATSAALIPDGTYMQGWTRVKSSQFQFTGTKSMPNIMGAEQLVLIGEAGFNWFHNLPPGQKFNGPAVFLPATQFGSVLSSAFSVQNPDAFLTEFSWGYRLAARMEFANALFGGNLAPRYAFAHDVKGVGPNFNQGVKSQSVGISWDYQRRWIVDLQFTDYSGGRTFCGTDVPPPTSVVTPGQSASWCSSANPLRDRDFYSFSVSYSF
ncbi:MAG TPA: DUF1302 domain-containing protein [Vicinamibacterales bacterium]|nr:DUF1302 domain-containing protein [Vicinamibacterales bacterium]